MADDSIEIPVKIPIPWLKRFAAHIITVGIMALMTLFSAWFTQDTLSRHQKDTGTAISTNQAQIDELKDEIQDCRQLNKDLKHDLSELKRILGITEKGDVTIRKMPPSGE